MLVADEFSAYHLPRAVDRLVALTTPSSGGSQALRQGVFNVAQAYAHAICSMCTSKYFVRFMQSQNPQYQASALRLPSAIGYHLVLCASLPDDDLTAISPWISTAVHVLERLLALYWSTQHFDELFEKDDLNAYNSTPGLVAALEKFGSLEIVAPTECATCILFLANLHHASGLFDDIFRTTRRICFEQWGIDACSLPGCVETATARCSKFVDQALFLWTILNALQM